MHIEELVLENFCQFEHHVFRPCPGLNAIVGRNGQGKSNLLNGMLFALTGELDRLAGVKKESIRYGTPEHAKASVRLTLRHQPHTIAVSRFLQPPSQSLELAGLTYTSAKEIKQQMETVLGVSTRILLDYVFVGQWQMFAFLDASAAERAKAFGQLFGTQRLEQLWGLLGEKTLPLVVPPTESMAELASRREQLQTELLLLDDEIRLLPDLPSNFDPTVLAEFAILQKADAWQERYKAWQSALAACSVTEKQCDHLGRQLQQAQNDYLKLSAEFTPRSQELELAKQELVLREQLKSLYDYATAQWEQLKLLRGEATTDTEPQLQASITPIDLENEQKKQATLQQEITALQSFVSEFDPATGRSNCPTCHTPTTQLSHRHAEFSNKLQSLTGQYVESARNYSAFLEHFRNHSAWRIRSTQRNEKIAHLEASLNSLGSVQPPEDSGTLRQTILHLNSLYNSCENQRQHVAHLHGQLEVAKALLSHQKQELKQLEAATLAAYVEPAIAQAAREYIQQLKEDFVSLQRCRTQKQLLTQQLEQLDNQIGKLQEAQATAQRASNLATHLQEVRGLFHRDCLQRDVAEMYLARLVDGINGLLDNFEASFSVQLMSGLRFVVKKPGHLAMPAERLSGGEKAVLALAFRIVINSTFANALGLLCLDEPTVGLDKVNLGCLERALTRLREMSAAVGLQVIVVTHEERLSYLFDHVHSPAAN